ncbi:MAG: hypothetical protein HWN79_04240 [Candidatus Lokiarchaeota archaeon]|nr:hypothetical protein [Candidatus Lokiarchaeota archaeon]
MEFEEKLSVIFLEFIKQTIDLEFFIDQMISLIEDQSVEGVWKEVMNSFIPGQNSLFLKIVHIYSITIFETFNREFFNELNEEKNLIRKNFKTTPLKILKFFDANFQINFENEFKIWEELRECICRRNVIAHNMGKIDEAYIECNKHPDMALIDKVIGIDIDHNLEYIKKSNDTVGKYIVFTFKKIAEYYKFIDIESTVKIIAENGYFDDVNSDLLNDVDI